MTSRPQPTTTRLEAPNLPADFLEAGASHALLVFLDADWNPIPDDAPDDDAPPRGAVAATMTGYDTRGAIVASETYLLQPSDQPPTD